MSTNEEPSSSASTAPPLYTATGRTAIGSNNVTDVTPVEVKENIFTGVAASVLEQRLSESIAPTFESGQAGSSSSASSSTGGSSSDLMLDSATWKALSDYRSRKSPINVIVLGMAGSGKTTFVTRLADFLARNGQAPYCINLDPACLEVPFHAHIDIRDSINYKALMKDYNLGPNGAIVTALNLYSTKIIQVMELLGKRKQDHSVYLFDTPGQIEVFTWSASGGLISESLAQQFPTIIIYVMDTVANSQPTTFVSNMLYACSIMYKMKLPFIIAMNKVDAKDCHFALEWMQDFEKLDKVLEADDSYIASFSQSLVLAIEEFYSCIKCAGISSKTGAGLGKLAGMIVEAAKEYESDYKPIVEEAQKNRQKDLQDEHAKKLEQLRKNLEQGKI